MRHRKRSRNRKGVGTSLNALLLLLAKHLADRGEARLALDLVGFLVGFLVSFLVLLFFFCLFLNDALHLEGKKYLNNKNHKNGRKKQHTACWSTKLSPGSTTSRPSGSTERMVTSSTSMPSIDLRTQNLKRKKKKKRKKAEEQE